MAETCIATTTEGKPCPSPRANGTEYCIFHNPDPAQKEATRLARLKGGLHRRQIPQVGDYPDTVKTANQLLEYINAALADSRTIEGTIQRLTVTASLLRIAVDVLPIVDTSARLEILENLFYKEGLNGTNKATRKSN
jgi:hypothetical protein